MQIIKKTVCLFLSVLMLVHAVNPVMAASSEKVMLYAPDGRVKQVSASEVDSNVANGWSKSPVELKFSKKDANYAYGNGVLIVSGLSEIPSTNPYKNKNIKTLYVGRGVKKLGNFSFERCSNLARVELSDTVTEIGSYVFYESNITRIGIPKSVTSLDGYSFDAYGLSYYYSANKKMVIYCERGSKAEAFAKEKNIKYVYATMVYSLDGRTMMVDDNERDVYLASGIWFSSPDYVKMYAVDGRTKIVKKSDVEANKKVGWYLEPMIKMYATDGRTKYVKKSQVNASQKVGWYLEPVTKMYAADGRSKYVEESKVEANQKVGWYLEPVTKVYALDGRTKVVKKVDVEAYKKVGWLTEAPVKMYALDGRTKYVKKSYVEANKKVGWLTEAPVKVYALDGRTKYVKKSDVATYKKVGWYDNKAELELNKNKEKAKKLIYDTSKTGNLTGVITKHSYYTGPVAAVGLNVVLIQANHIPLPTDESELKYLGMGKDVDPMIHGTDVDGLGNYYFNDVPAGKYYLLIFRSGSRNPNRDMESAREYLGNKISYKGLKELSHHVYGDGMVIVEVEIKENRTTRYNRNF